MSVVFAPSRTRLRVRPAVLVSLGLLAVYACHEGAGDKASDGTPTDGTPTDGMPTNGSPMSPGSGPSTGVGSLSNGMPNPTETPNGSQTMEGPTVPGMLVGGAGTGGTVEPGAPMFEQDDPNLHPPDTSFERVEIPTPVPNAMAIDIDDQDRVYVLGAMGRLFALDVKSGRVLWEKDYVTDFNASVPTWGMAGAPLVDGNLLICLVGGKPDAKLIALDKRTGKEVWRALSSNTEPGYNQPIIISAGGVRQLILFHPEGFASLDPTTGKVFWEIEHRVQMGIVVATPVHSGRYLFFTSQHGGARMLALDEHTPAAKILWSGPGEQDPGMTHDTPDTVNSVIGTPVIEGEYVYALDNDGQLRCLNAATGKLVWKTDALLGEHAMYGTAFFVKNGDGSADLKPIAHLYKTQVYQLAEYLGVPETIRTRPPTTDTYSLPQTQEEFYFSLPYDKMDLCLYARNNGIEAADIGPALGLTEQQVERVFRDIDAKRRASRYLHLAPQLVADGITEVIAVED